MLQSRWVGRRVSVRRVVERAADGRLLQSDVVGDLVELDAQTAVVDGREGLVEIPVALVTAAKLAPPSAAEELALEGVAAYGWRAEITGALDGWLLRADHGFTSRANSVLPLRQLHRPLDEALDEAAMWYSAQGLPLLVAVPIDARRLLDAGLAERGWVAQRRTQVLTGRLDLLRTQRSGAAEQPDRPPVALAAHPDDAWLGLFCVLRGDAARSTHAVALLARHERVAFATVQLDGRSVAIGRGCIDEGWLGISAVEVDPAYRRQGLATALTGALWDWARTRGATRSYLQVAADNESARALYSGLGYRRHHDYQYRRPFDATAGDKAPDNGGPWSST